MNSSKPLIRLYCANLVSGIGNWMSSLVILSWVFGVSHRPLWLGIAIGAHRLPIVVGSWVLAGLTEKNPRIIHAYADFIRSAIVLAMCGVVAHHSVSRPDVDQAWKWLCPFLALAAFRSLLSGVDKGTEAKLVSIYATDIAPASGAQQSLQMILSLTGLIAALFYLFGILQANFESVLFFDSMSFIASGALFLFAVPATKVISPAAIGTPVTAIGAVFAHPSIWFVLIGHSLRILGMSVLLQALLVLLRVRFGMGPESAGYMYVILTLAWSLAAAWVKRASSDLARWSDTVYLSGCAAVCLSILFLWRLESRQAVFVLVGIICFIDGVLLTLTAGALQKNVHGGFIGRVFSLYEILTSGLTVAGSLVLGQLCERLGYIRAADLIAGGAFVVLILVLVTEYLIRPIKDGIWIWLRMKLLGHDPKVAIELPYSGQIGFGSFTVTDGSNRVTGSCASLDGEASGLFNVACYEFLERWSTRHSLGANLPLPSSSGVALAETLDEASERSYLELLERDSALFHDLFERPPLRGLDLKKTSASELGPTMERSLRSIDAANAYRLFTPGQENASYWIVVEKDGKSAYGWASSLINESRGVTKSFEEAMAVLRAQDNPQFGTVQSRLAKINRENLECSFKALAAELNIPPALIQIALVLAPPEHARRMKFLSLAPPSHSLDELIGPMPQSNWYACPTAEYRELQCGFQSPFFVVQAQSAQSFEPSWPFIKLRDLKRISAAKGLQAPNFAQDPLCLIY